LTDSSRNQTRSTLNFPGAKSEADMLLGKAIGNAHNDGGEATTTVQE